MYNIPSNLTTRIILPLTNTPLAFLASAVLAGQYWLYQKKPGLVLRLSSFLPIGGASTVIQFTLLTFLKSRGVETFTAIAIAVELSLLCNFCLNWRFTWQDRFAHHTSRQKLMAFLPLFIAFNLTTPSVPLKIMGVGGLEHALHMPILLAWFLMEAICTVLNYIGADKLSFGFTAKILSHPKLIMEQPSL